MPFTQGHALIVGISKYKNISNANVPIAIHDTLAVAKIIKDQDLCGYPANQVEYLLDQDATRSGTLAAFDRLAERVCENDTVFVFYCGHGALGTDGSFYLVSHDARAEMGRVLPGSGVSEAELIEKLRQLPVQRALLIFNTCYSGKISPSLALGEPTVTPRSLSVDTSSALLATGSGRIILTACRETEESLIGDGPLSIFAQALVDGLSGQGVRNSAGFISAYSLYEYIYLTVSETVNEDFCSSQEPELTVIKGVGPFAVSLYKGASTLGSIDPYQPAPDLPTVRQVKPESAQRAYAQIIQVHNGAVAIGKGARAVGQGGILVEGNVGGDVLGSGATKTGK
jgi:hypothetical protein